jgi:ribosome-associated protein
MELTSNELALRIVKVLQDKKAKDIRLLHVENQTVLTDYMVICEGTSSTQIKAIADEIQFVLEAECEITPHGADGMREGSWIVLDYLYVMVHIFHREARSFYNLEKLWQDATEVEIPADEE